jgi:uncharacterized membrane protein YphA (DoxX/SURF4 family)
MSETGGRERERGESPGWRVGALVPRLLALGLGLLFLWMGLAKALDPVGFLKLVRQYGVVEGPPWLNVLAACLPWFEAFCGALWVFGVAVRGTAAVLLAMLVSFTALVWRHALALQATTGLSFCQIRFDCGCGSGEVWICAKLVENGLLLLAAGFLLVHRPAAEVSDRRTRLFEISP